MTQSQVGTARTRGRRRWVVLALAVLLLAPLELSSVPGASGQTASSGSGYWLYSLDGGIFSFGDARFHGSLGNRGPNDGCGWEGGQWCLGGASHPSGNGYWLLNNAICRVFNFGAARHHGDRVRGPQRAQDDFASCGAIASTPSGNGYWLVTSLGSVLSYGDAGFYGDLARPPTALVVDIVPTPSGRGYWLLSLDGGVFSFGDARFFGSTGGRRLNQPVIGMARTPTGNGYWLVALDGGIFSFGAARFYGSTGAMRLNQPIIGLTAAPSGNGYWLVALDGGIFTFGAARFLGSTGGMRLNQPVLGMMLS